jgi:hypothetical protein
MKSIPKKKLDGQQPDLAPIDYGIHGALRKFIQPKASNFGWFKNCAVRRVAYTFNCDNSENASCVVA